MFLAMKLVKTVLWPHWLVSTVCTFMVVVLLPVVVVAVWCLV